MSHILIKFRQGKPTEFKPEGIPGLSCREITAPFEKIIGGRVVSDTDTAEAQMLPVDASNQINIPH